MQLRGMSRRVGWGKAPAPVFAMGHRFHTLRHQRQRCTTPSTFVRQFPAPHTPADTAPRRELEMYEKADAAELVSRPLFASYINNTCEPKDKPIHHGVHPGKRARLPGGVEGESALQSQGGSRWVGQGEAPALVLVIGHCFHTSRDQRRRRTTPLTSV